MRRNLATVLAIGLFGGMSMTPASAQNAVDLIIFEGIGFVCDQATGLSQSEYNQFGQYAPNDYIRDGGTNATTNASHFRLKTPAENGGTAPRPGAWCNYPGNANDRKRGNTSANPTGTPTVYDLADPLNYGKTARPDWWRVPTNGSTYWAENVWRPQAADGSAAQGLFLPGLGPGARGPYEVKITAGPANPPKNVCISTNGGAGCATRTAGALTPAPINGFGAHAGSSHGNGNTSFTAAGGGCSNTGNLGWDNSAATILPLHGELTGGCGEGAQLDGFTSSRGVSGESATYGDAGASKPTNGFQVEGMLVVHE